MKKISLAELGKLALHYNAGGAVGDLNICTTTLRNRIKETLGCGASLWTVTHLAVMGYIYKNYHLTNKELAAKLNRSELMIARLRQKMGHKTKWGGDRSSANWVDRHYKNERSIKSRERVANPVDRVVMVRKLDDRTEEYESETLGNCQCGLPVVRVNGSNQTNNTDGTRYRYPGRYDAWCIFRCQKCGSVMMDSFKEA